MGTNPRLPGGPRPPRDQRGAPAIRSPATGAASVLTVRQSNAVPRVAPACTAIRHRRLIPNAATTPAASAPVMARNCAARPIQQGPGEWPRPNIARQPTSAATHPASVARSTVAVTLSAGVGIAMTTIAACQRPSAQEAPWTCAAPATRPAAAPAPITTPASILQSKAPVAPSMIARRLMTLAQWSAMPTNAR